MRTGGIWQDNWHFVLIKQLAPSVCHVVVYYFANIKKDVIDQSLWLLHHSHLNFFFQQVFCLFVCLYFLVTCAPWDANKVVYEQGCKWVRRCTPALPVVHRCKIECTSVHSNFTFKINLNLWNMLYTMFLKYAFRTLEGSIGLVFSHPSWVMWE